MTTVVEHLKLKELTPYHNNPRLNDEAVEYVRRSIDEFGFLVPIVVDKKKVIITGHTRYKAAEKLALKTVPVIIAKDLTPAQIKAFRIADNKVSEYSGWNESLLAQELSELESMGFDLLGTGFTAEDIDCLLEPVDADCLDDLTLESVCGDIEKVEIKDKLQVAFSIGGYNMHMALADFHEWEKHMLNTYGGKLGIRKELFKRLQISDFVTRQSSGLDLKKSIEADGKPKKKKKIKVVSK